MKETLNNLCYDERGGLKEKNECRAAMINHLILEDGLDIDAAEDTADKFIRECGIWPMPKFDWDEDEATKTEST